LFSELFVLINFFSPLLEELVHLFFAGWYWSHACCCKTWIYYNREIKWIN
jgi:hypothetical protein